MLSYNSCQLQSMQCGLIGTEKLREKKIYQWLLLIIAKRLFNRKEARLPDSETRPREKIRMFMKPSFNH